MMSDNNNNNHHHSNNDNNNHKNNTNCVLSLCRRILSVEESPKPPPERITMSLPVLNAVKAAVFVAMGEGKAEVVQRVLEVNHVCLLHKFKVSGPSLAFLGPNGQTHLRLGTGPYTAKIGRMAVSRP